MQAQLALVVIASDAVAATPKRSEKTAILASLLSQVSPVEAAICVGMLSGEPRQGRVGVGWATFRDLEVTSAEQPSLTIVEVDEAITAIAEATGPGSAASRRTLLAGLMARATEPERSFLRALLAGELRQGALGAVMGDAIARAAGVSTTATRRALMLSGDLTRTAEIAIVEGEPGLLAVGLELMRPVLPMLASPGASVAEAMSAFGYVSVEHKLDGLRVQIHRRGDEVQIFSRNLNDLTARLPGIVAATRALPVDAVVLDGEALWMGSDGPASFQETMSQIDADAPPEGVVTFLFDVLHVDGVDLLDAPHHERRTRLSQIAPQLMVTATVTDDISVGEQVLKDALDAGHEGVVIKDVDSTYAAGRRGAAWRKVKPVHTYDLVVLGAEWGHGRRQGRLSNLHLGARAPDTDGFVMVGKTFKGLTDELLAWQTEALLARETGRQGIAVLVAPELVIEIAIDGVQASTRYPGGVALRFARVKRYRPDKQPAQADTIDTLRALLTRGRRT
ncbi:MAG TPA: ATP-dependent DNA ligase [Solirubrobacteraceae bacterium]|jgi:DNA ligase-1